MRFWNAAAVVLADLAAAILVAGNCAIIVSVLIVIRLVFA